VTGGDGESEGIDRPRTQSAHDANRVVILANADGAFAEQVLALDAVRQRKLAAWAARWACHFAEIDARSEVARALQSLDDDGQLPELFRDNRSGWAQIHPPLREPGFVRAYTRPVGEGPRITLVPWAAAGDALFSADNADPAAAAVNALVGACGGQADLTQLLSDARSYIEGMTTSDSPRQA
jgi:hypothetical protein